jgi:hypothetical protein
VVSVAPDMDDSNPIVFTVTTQPLPVPWLDQDVGAVGLAGSGTYASGTFTVAGAGLGTFKADSKVLQRLAGQPAASTRIRGRNAVGNWRR